MRLLNGLILLLFIVSFSFAADAGLESLVGTERAFAKLASQHGERDAFLYYLGDDAVIFRPAPVPARSWYEARQPSPGLLTWDPSMADCSCDLGYTTGPWEYREKEGAPPIAFGAFLSLWKRQSDGSWKLMLDAGTEYPKPDTSPASFSVADAKAHSSESSDVSKERVALAEADRRLERASSARGFTEALSEVLIESDESRLIRDQMQPLLGKDSILEYLNRNPTKLKWDARRVELSSCGNFGYTYGTLEIPGSPKPTQGVFVRIWRKVEGHWKVIVDYLSMIRAA